MNTLTRVLTTVSDFYKEINPSTLSGAIDVVVVEQSDGTFHCSPFHVRFGKLHLLRPQEKVVEVKVNGSVVDLSMKVGEAGEAFFVMETKMDIPHELETSPLGLTPSKDFDVAPLELETRMMLTDLPPPAVDVLGVDQLSAPPSSASVIYSPLLPSSSSQTEPTKEQSMSDTELETRVPSVYRDHQKKPTFKVKMPQDQPVSDSEMDYSHDKLESGDWNWRWGGLPSRWEDEASMPLPVDEKPEEFNINAIVPSTELLRSKVEISLCGSVQVEGKTPKELFDEKQVDFDTFLQKPGLLADPKLIFCVNGSYYTWHALQPLLMSEWLFNRPLPKSIIKDRFDSFRSTESRKLTWSEWWSSGKKEKVPMTASATVPRVRNDVVKAPVVPEVKRYTKTLRLTSEQIHGLNLKYGSNSVSFSVTSSYSGVATCHARIFLWKSDVKIVVSDIDGTITKSDALGHLFTMVGRDWTHPGIANLYTNIVKNGYNILYLTSRAIGQADMTRGYLKGVEQGSYQLPDGPVIMSPDRLIAALKREVIDRRPEEFKIACLTDIKRLFGGRSPFYAGFGNRMTDALSYRAVDIPPSRIYSISSNGEVKMDFFYGYSSSYIKLADLVDHIFPPLASKQFKRSANSSLSIASTSDTIKTVPSAESLESDKPKEEHLEVIEEEYNDFNYWRSELPEIIEQSSPEPDFKPSVATYAVGINYVGLDSGVQKRPASTAVSPSSSTVKRTESISSAPAASTSYTEGRSWILPWSGSKKTNEEEEEDEDYDEDEEYEEDEEELGEIGAEDPTLFSLT